jgi:cyclopropane-fatty-acyl-phospholipid synthase
VRFLLYVLFETDCTLKTTKPSLRAVMNMQNPRRGHHLVIAGWRGLWSRLVARLFNKWLDRFDMRLLHGSIDVLLPDGTTRLLGGQGKGPHAVVHFIRWRTLIRLARGGSIGGYQSWVDGDWSSPDPVVMFDLFMRNRATFGEAGRPSGLSRLAKRILYGLNSNNRMSAKRNIRAHYDLGNDFYQLWLDKTMSYSSGIFKEPFNEKETLESAQARKIAALCSRLNLSPQSDILEIGCGWGHFARLCAENGHNVTAITLSPAQLFYAETTVAKQAKRPTFALCDYRDVAGMYDAIVSTEMVEAVGQAYWPTYLDVIARHLKPGGRAALQFIIVADDIFESYAKSVDFIQRYIFPGGMLLSESRFRKLAETHGLKWENPTYFGVHYAETLRRWRVRFDEAVEGGKLPKEFDARFVKLWRYYLMYCEGGFRGGGIDVGQVTLIKMKEGA